MVEWLSWPDRVSLLWVLFALLGAGATTCLLGDGWQIRRSSRRSTWVVRQTPLSGSCSC